MSKSEEIIGGTSGVNFNIFEKTLCKEFKEHFIWYADGLVKGDPGGFVLTAEYARNADKVRNFQPREDDVWLVTFPKCGTTWVQELLWLLMNNCDTKSSLEEPLHERSPFLEFPYLIPVSDEDSKKELNMIETVELEIIETMPSPRVIKSHLPLYLLNPNLLNTCKVVYVSRNPKDVIVSFFYHHKLIKLHTYTGDLEQFAEYFMNDECYYSPFFPHVLEAWAQRHHPNLHFVFYEDMKKDLKGEVKRMADFLGKQLEESNLEKLVEHLRFENFAKNESVNGEMGKELGFLHPEQGFFIRKGKTGDWKNHFSTDLNKRIDDWIETNLRGSDLEFVTELEFQD